LNEVSVGVGIAVGCDTVLCSKLGHCTVTKRREPVNSVTQRKIPKLIPYSVA